MNSENIKAIIVDDELSAIKSLKHELSSHCLEVDVLDEVQTIEEAYKAINKHNPDLVFLDIDLGKRSSFELLDLFTEIPFQVIFVTAHNDFAIKAIKYSALDYILKPANGADLISAVTRVKKKLNHTESFALLKEQIQGQKVAKKIALQIGEKILLVNIPNILYCESDGNFTKVHLLDKTHFVSRNLKELDFLLQNQGFHRIHRSFLINLDHIKNYTLSNGGYIVMDNDHSIPISKRKKEDFLKILRLFGAK